MTRRIQLLALMFFTLPLGGRAQDAGEELPAPLKDCVYLRQEAFKWYVQYDHAYEGRWFALYLGHDHNRKSHFTKDRRMIAVGETFFKRGPAKDRFRFLEFIEREVTNRQTNVTMKVPFARFEDLKPNKKGTIYESQYGLPDPEIDRFAQYDRTAILAYKSPTDGKVTELKVEEFTRFAFPPGSQDEAYFLKEVSPQQVLIEYSDSNKKPRIARIAKPPEEPAYKALVQPTTEEAKTLLQRLEIIQISSEGVKDVEAREAFRLINRGAHGEKAAIINFVLRGADTAKARISLKEKTLTFAEAIDSLCHQANCRWALEFDPESKIPVAVISSVKD